MTVYTHFIGIDIGKFEVVVGTHGDKSTMAFANTQDGFEVFFTTYNSLFKEALVILETTGGYEKLFLNALIERGVAVHRANTRQVKAFIHSLGNKGKTDALDAISLARYGYERHDRLALYQPVKDHLEILASLAQRRLDLNKMLVAEKNRYQAPNTPNSIKMMCDSMIAVIQDQLSHLMDEMQTLMKEDPLLAEKQEVLKTVSGIGDITAAMLVVLLPELGHLNRREIASLTGLAPYPNESGTRTGYRRTKGGRQDVKSVLFMAGMAAAHSKSRLGDSYRKLLARGKKKMVALVAIMRKIIVIANTRVKEYLDKKETTAAHVLTRALYCSF